MIFGWVLSMAGGVHLTTPYDGCDGPGSSLRAEVVGILSHSTNGKIQQEYQHQDYLHIR